MDQQPRAVPRLTMASLFGQIADEFFSLDRGLPWTFVQLTIRPARALRAYYDVREPRMTKPVRYFIIALAVAGFAFAMTGVSDAFAKGLRDGFARPVGSGSLTAVLIDLLQRPELTFTLTFVPLLALTAAAAFRRLDLNFAEALAASAYLSSNALLLLAFATGLLYAVGMLNDTALSLLHLALFLGYPAAALARCVGGGKATWGRAFVATIFAMVFGFFATGVVLGVTAALEGRMFKVPESSQPSP